MFMLYQLDSYDNVRRYTLVVETINNVNEDIACKSRKSYVNIVNR